MKNKSSDFIRKKNTSKKWIAKVFVGKTTILNIMQFSPIRTFDFPLKIWLPDVQKPLSFFTCNWRARQQFHNKNIGSSLSFNLIFSIVHWSNVIGFFLVMKHYKRDTFPWADTIGAAVFDWRKLLYTDVANTHTYWYNLQRGVRVQVTYIQSRTPWYFHINNYCWWSIYVKAKYLVHFPRFF